MEAMPFFEKLKKAKIFVECNKLSSSKNNKQIFEKLKHEVNSCDNMHRNGMGLLKNSFNKQNIENIISKSGFISSYGMEMLTIEKRQCLKSDLYIEEILSENDIHINRAIHSKHNDTKDNGDILEDMSYLSLKNQKLHFNDYSTDRKNSFSLYDKSKRSKYFPYQDKTNLLSPISATVHIPIRNTTETSIICILDSSYDDSITSAQGRTVRSDICPLVRNCNISCLFVNEDYFLISRDNLSQSEFKTQSKIDFESSINDDVSLHSETNSIHFSTNFKPFVLLLHLSMRYIPYFQIFFITITK